VPELPRHPVIAWTSYLSDLAELAQHVVTIERHPDRRYEDQVMILPQRSSLEPVGSPARVVLAECLHG